MTGLVVAARQEHGDHGAGIIAALFRGEDSVEADAGAFLVADALWKWMKTPTMASE